MVVKLLGDADHVIALGLQQRSRHRRVDTAGHGDDDTGVLRAAIEVETVDHDDYLLTGGDAPYAMKAVWKRCNVLERQILPVFLQPLPG
jgi:hypothetical protein